MTQITVNDESARALRAIADNFYDGHFTIMKFTTNWRVGFGTVSTRDDISAMSEGATLHEAAHKAITKDIAERYSL